MKTRKWTIMRSLFVCACLGTISAEAAPSGVVLDGSFGSTGALSGPNYIITAGMGRQVGSNLFESFNTFNLTSSESATFTATGSTGAISNILARVTGGSPSSIDGTINSTISGANLFLINPAGVMFGPNAQVNVSGAFVVGSPNYVKFADGGVFNSSLGNDSQLTSAPVSAFGFLSAPASVTFTNSQITVPSGTGLHVIAGDITLDGASLSASSGYLTLFSAAGSGEVPFSFASPGSGFASSTVTAYGAINLKNGAAAAINGFGGGAVVIRGGRLTVDNASISSLNFGNSTGGSVAVQASQVTITNGGFVTTDSYSNAGAGSISVNATGDVNVSGSGSQISADAEAGGSGGLINVITSGNLVLDDGGDILANTDGTGDGGTVSVQALSLIMGASSRLSTVSAGGGNAGTITAAISGPITLSVSAAIVADTYTAGRGGDINIQAASLTLTQQTVISANTFFGSGKGGNITVQTGSLSILGDGTEAPDSFGITAQSYTSGNAGVIDIQTGAFTLSGTAEISTASFAGGEGGSVTVNGTQGSLSDALISASSVFTNAGSITITAADFLKLINGSSLSTSAGGAGGDISLAVGQLLYLSNSSILAYAGVGSTPSNPGGGNGGNITIDPDFVVLDNSVISANDLSPIGHDGNINNAADYLFTTDSTLHATGTIDSTPPDLDLAASLLILPADLVHAERQLRESCARATNHEFSSFIVTGRGGTESGPDELRPDFGTDFVASSRP
jgi:filamentous hemagglutinin family protein